MSGFSEGANATFNGEYWQTGQQKAPVQGQLHVHLSSQLHMQMSI